MKEADRRSNTFLDVIQIPIDVDWNLEKISQRGRDIIYDNAFNSTSNQIKRVLAWSAYFLTPYKMSKFLTFCQVFCNLLRLNSPATLLDPKVCMDNSFVNIYGSLMDLKVLLNESSKNFHYLIFWKFSVFHQAPKHYLINV